MAKLGFSLAVRVQPRAKRDAVREILADGRVKIGLTSPPIDGRANQALIKYLANVLEVSKGAISISLGASTRDKVLWIDGITEQAGLAKLQKLAAS